MSGTGKADQMWPIFKATKPDPVLGRKEMTPEQTLVEFISTSAAFHGVKSQSLRSLEWDLLKVFPNNIMPANAAAWYMAKRKFYANQPLDQQLLAFLLKKYPDKFKLTNLRVDFLESYSKETARRKMIYLVQFGLHAYFSHKVEEHGVYFFDPSYYIQTEPFHESLRTCQPGNNKVQFVTGYFAMNKDQFSYKSHSQFLASVSVQPGAKVITNTTGVIVSMVNNQYGNLKFGSGEVALFCAKSLFKDGWQYNGDPLELPAMKFDAYQMASEETEGDGPTDGSATWIAVLVWYGKKPATRYYSTVADFSYTPLFQSKRRQLQQPVEGKKLRQPSSSMMIGQVIAIKKNGGVLSVRDDSDDKVFVPGWRKEVANRSGAWLSTLTGDCIGLRDLVAYYIDVDESMPGYTAVGKNVMVLKEHEETESGKPRRSRRSVSMSAGADYHHREDEFEDESEDSDTSDISDADREVSDSELEWLEKDLTQMMVKDGPGSKTVPLFQNVLDSLAKARKSSGRDSNKKKGRKRSGRDSGLESKETTPKATRLPYPPTEEASIPSFWRTKAALEALELMEDKYRSSEDEDYHTSGHDSDSEKELPSPSRRRKRSRVESSVTSATSATSTSTNKQKEAREAPAAAGGRGGERLPYWVRAISLPYELEPETGKLIPVDRWYKEERDPDYEVPLSDDEYPEDEEDTEQDKSGVAETAATNETATAGPADAVAAANEGDAAVAANDGPAADKAVDSPTAAVIEGPLEATSKPPKKAVGSQISKDRSLPTKIPAEELELLLKEAAEPLPEDLLQGAHHDRPGKKAVTPPEAEKEEKKEGEEEEGANIEGEKEEKTNKEPVVSEFVRWIRKTLHPEAQLPEEDSEEDEDYVPPTLIMDDDLDFGEHLPPEVEADEVEEVKSELAGLLADQAAQLHQLAPYLHAIWVPVESVRVRRENYLAQLEAEDLEKKEQEKEQVKETEEQATEEALRKSTSVLETGLTPAMKKLTVAENAKAEKKVTRAKVDKEPKKSSKKSGSAASPTKPGSGGKGNPEAEAVAAATSDDTADAAADPQKGTSDTAATGEKGDTAPKRKSSGVSPKKKSSPRRKKSESGEKKQKPSKTVDEKGDGIDHNAGGAVSAAAANAEDPQNAPAPSAGNEAVNGGSTADGGDKPSAACVQN